MKRLIFLFAFFASSAFAQGVIVNPKTVLGTTNGLTKPIPSATITVCAASALGVPCTPALAGVLFKDAALTQPLSNPFFSDANGNYQFAIAGGTYTITETASGFIGYSYQLTVSCAPGICSVTSLTVTGNAAINGNLSVAGSFNPSSINVNGPATFTGPLNSNNLTTGNVANKATTAQAVRFVANDGNDANDGLSWGTAKLTVAAACATIPNQDVTCQLPLGFGTMYIADTFTGSYPSGFLTGLARALKIIGPGYIQADSSLTSARGAIIDYPDDSFIELNDGGLSTFIQAGPRGKECFPITATAISSGTLTVTCTNTFSPAETARISGTQESFLNGQVCTVGTASGAQWTTTTAGCVSHGNFTNNSDFGLAAEKSQLAANTLTTPDLSGGTSTPAPGVLLGVTATVDAVGGGNCLFYNGGTATGLSGLMNNSGFGCNTNILFPTVSRYVGWTSGSFTGTLFPVGGGLSASRNWFLPDAGGNVVIDSASQTLTNKNFSPTANVFISTTAPTIAGAGCGGTVAAIQNANGTASFEIFTGTAPTSAGCTVTFPAATHHWICPTITHTSAVSTTNFIILQTGALSSTSVTFQLFSDVAAATAPTASDTWAVSGCHAN